MRDKAAQKAANAQRRIKELRARIDAAYAEIDRIATEHISDFHFLDWKVSTFWDCAQSPIGMCVFPSDAVQHIEHTEPVCRYCGDPEERK